MSASDESPMTKSAPVKGGSLAGTASSSDCKLYELIQYQCEMVESKIECTPIPRLFLKCPGKPTTEVTPEYDQNGDPLQR
ncbi:hypothetical protein J3Q64DRAFT_1292041 [Phycomyces blakesleeanus]|uniref:Uncharacterized protein n=2 Tax=Phycomyces blakesleeanus TaxID=4837 RepID=A0A167N516_PHYB8|nr:hypothetical protein PHYBLDRAFT_144362 [Phycomyces blakesleeanus NRRL 1555(-)]OAD75010.1 hypothetical protein PHYBLDRAFT_144362 [Phycomyces blakesleeanus NRRL 1555(-)]|eukprot:XP_018293050.1 hypothetical protein PHYBLDRAFT_144362 [Phycomyces blakesleeanus NRRL 1555(-)]